MKNIYVLNGPNLSLLGKRQQIIYGNKTLEDVSLELQEFCQKQSVEVRMFQSNIEGEFVTFLNELYLKNLEGPEKLNTLGVIVNPGALGHTSYSLYDALIMFKDLSIPFFEVHISNIYSREAFRQKSVLSSIATGVISGFGTSGYLYAVQQVIKLAQPS